MSGGRKRPVVAIDGPAGSGKSVVSRLTAQALNYRYVDTGAMYRAATLVSMRSGIPPEREAELVRELNRHQMEFDYRDGFSRVILDGEDVSNDIRSPELTRLIGPVCELDGVRRLLGELQRDMGRDGAVVLEGRDIGTVIFPDAEVKIYLDAAPEVRAERRWNELLNKGIEVDYDEVLADIHRRDERDMSRSVAPLQKAKDAIQIDTTDMSIEEVVNEIVQIVKAREAEL